MFVVTFLDFKTFRIKVLAAKKTLDEASRFLYSESKNHILKKDGERNMKIVPADDITLARCPIVIGCFLSEIEKNCLDLYEKVRTTEQGFLATSVAYRIEKLGRYQISETNPVETIDDFVATNTYTDIPAPPPMPRAPGRPAEARPFDSVIQEMVKNGYKKSLKSVKSD